MREHLDIGHVVFRRIRRFSVEGEANQVRLRARELDWVALGFAHDFGEHRVLDAVCVCVCVRARACVDNAIVIYIHQH